MTKNTNKKDKRPAITTKTKMDNSIEIQINKAPSKTLFGKILVWAVCVCTFLGIVASLVFVIIEAVSK